MKTKPKIKKNEGKVCRTFWIPSAVNRMIVDDMKLRGFPSNWFSKWFTEAALGECAVRGNIEALQMKEQFKSKHSVEVSMKKRA